MENDSKKFYQMDYDLVNDDDGSESSTLITNKESLRDLNEQIAKIIDNDLDNEIFKIKYQESQNPEEVPFNYIKLQNAPEEIPQKKSSDIGCWIIFILIVLFILTLITLALIGLNAII